MIEFDLDGSGMNRVLLRLQRDVENPAHIMDAAGLPVAEMVRMTFIDSHSPDGEPWPP